jgi:hypothetical protein
MSARRVVNCFCKVIELEGVLGEVKVMVARDDGWDGVARVAC